MNSSHEVDKSYPDEGPDTFSDTCLICYGDASQEPLYHPCKCKGSIKFVHQACLVEWLSRTNKKHCDRCKVPFIFSKVYAANTPQTLPLPVLLRKLIHHGGRQLVTWIRIVFVILVWLVFLPWSIRLFWRLLFWLADGGWARDLHVRNYRLSHTANVTADAPVAASGASTSLDSSIIAPSIARVFPLAPIFRRIVDFYSPDTSALQNLSQLAASSNATSTTYYHGQSWASLLSDVSVFRQLSVYPTLNRIFLDILEGQIIAMSIIISFVLIFLIREWVVQQLPNPDAAFPELHQDGVGVDFIPPELDVFPINGDAADALREDGFEIENDNSGTESDIESIVGSVSDRSDLSQGSHHSAHSAAHSSQNEIHEDTVPGLDDLPVQGWDSSSVAGDSGRSDEYHLDSGGSASLAPDPVSSFADESGAPALVPTVRTLAMSLPPLIRRSILDGDVDLFESAVSYYFQSDPSLERRLQFLSVLSSGYVACTKQRSPDDDIAVIFHVRLDDGVFEDPVRSANGLLDRVVSPNPKGKDVVKVETRWLDFLSLNVMLSAIEPKLERHGDFLPDGSRVPRRLRSQDGLHELSSDHRDLSHGENPELKFPASPALESSDNGIPLPSNSSDFSASVSLQPHRTGEDGFLDQTPQQFQNTPDQTVAPATTPTVHPQQPQAHPPHEQGAFLNPVINWFWGEINMPDAVPPPPVQLNAAPNAPEPAPLPGPADELAGVDFGDDVEDLEGIFELLGLQGPMIGLFQNSVFSLILISATIIAAIWFPYLWGKFVLLLIGGASPLTIFRLPFELAGTVVDVVFDLSLGCAGFLGFLLLRVVRYLFGLFFFWMTTIQIGPIALDELAASAKSLFLASTNRLLDVAGIVAVDSDYLKLSVHSHAALRSLESSLSAATQSTIGTLCAGFDQAFLLNPAQILRLPTIVTNSILNTFSSLADVAQFEVNRIVSDLSKLLVLDYHHRPGSFSTSLRSGLDISDPSLVYWSATDRSIAILTGYLTFIVLGGIYLYQAQKRPLTSSPQGRKIERIFYQGLRQAGGVLKVMVIIGIEMIVFPLYCGTLLDFALLPLFENATVASRLVYAMNSPWTAGFVHWFIGTSYMFHFALFVSMCRKILRKGVLHFIRDPDDPSNHRVRDVVEHNVTTQLRKIMFSAVVYGGLVLVCLGGVVWSLALGSDSILPLRSGCRNSLLETVFDLVVFGFFTPIILDRIQVNDALNRLYVWWFHASARQLRLSSFLLGRSSSRDRQPSHLPWPFGQHSLVSTQLAGRYVYAPASDQVRLAKGEPVFKEVAPNGKMSTEHLPHPHHQVGSHNRYKKVYIPPFFRVRIGLFVTSLWLFSVAAGMAVSVLPLLTGRAVLAAVSGRNSQEINDIYSFVTGLYLHGSLIFVGMWVEENYGELKSAVRNKFPTLATMGGFFKSLLSFAYVYSALTIFLPIAITTVFEIYFLLPFHYVFQPTEKHTIHLIQNWTLGILYVRLLYEYIENRPHSLMARIISSIFQQGWHKPKAVVATKSLIIPLVLLFVALIWAPLLVCTFINASILRDSDQSVKMMVYRIVYPVSSFICCNIGLGFLSRACFQRWQKSVIDEMYVVRERLHNFGEPAPDVRILDETTESITIH